MDSETNLTDYVKKHTKMATNYENAVIDILTIEKVKNQIPNALMIVVSASWCGDCVRNVPKVAKILDHLQWPVKIVERDTLTFEDRKVLQIERIPTFIVMKVDQELGRIVENPKYGSFEDDLLKIVMNEY